MTRPLQTPEEHAYAEAMRRKDEMNRGLTIRADLQSDEDVHALYTLVLIGPPTAHEYGYIEARIDPSLLRETEENLTDLLPPAYRVEIKEWNSE